MSEPATMIADVLREEQVLVTCPHCNVVVQYERHQFEGKFAPETLIPDAEARLRCRHCGKRGVRIRGQPRWRLKPEPVCWESEYETR